MHSKSTKSAKRAAKKPDPDKVTVAPAGKMVAWTDYPAIYARHIIKTGEEPLLYSAGDSSPAATWGINAFTEATKTGDAKSHTAAAEELLVHLLTTFEFGARQGDAYSAAILCRAAFLATEKLRRMAPAHPEVMKRMSTMMPAWPVLISPMNGWIGKDYIESILTELELGSALPQKTKGYDAKATEAQRFKGITHGFCHRLETAIRGVQSQRCQEWNSLAAAPVEWIRDAAALPAIPPRSAENAEKWFSLAWRALLWAYDGAPWEDQQLGFVASGRERVKRDSLQGALKMKLKTAWLARFKD